MKFKLLPRYLLVFLLALTAGLYATDWSALKDSLIISEIQPNSYSHDNEFLEIYNNSENAIDLTGMWVGDDDSAPGMKIPDTCARKVLPAGEYFTILVSATGINEGKPLTFTPDLNLVYDFTTASEIGDYFGLANGGDPIMLYAPDSSMIDSVNFLSENLDEWPFGMIKGIGISAELKSPDLDRLDPANWQSSMIYHGTPGFGPVDYESLPKVIISEIMYNDSISAYDYEFVELMNVSDSPVNIKDWSMTDYSISVPKYPFPDVTLAPGEFYTILTACDTTTETLDFTPDLDLSDSPDFMDLSNSGDNIILFNAGDTIVTYVKYDDDNTYFPHALNADGKGSSLEIVDPYGVNWNPQNWQASINGGGTPGALSFTPPTLLSATVVKKNTLNVQFSEELDSVSAVELTNYTIDRDMGNPVAAVWKGSEVVLTTSTIIAWDTTYTLMVENVRDAEAGFAIAENSRIEFSRNRLETDPPVVANVSAMTDSTVVVDFNEAVDNVSAGTVANYSIDNDVTILSAEVEDHSVELKVNPKLTLETEYTITIANIADTLDNTMTETVTRTFALKDYKNKIVINEFIYNSPSDDIEFVELYNASDETIDIANWRILSNPDPDTLYIADTVDTVLEPGDFFVIFIYGYKAFQKEPPCDMLVDYDWNAAYNWNTQEPFHVTNLQNGGSDLNIYDNEGRHVDRVDFRNQYDEFPAPFHWGTGTTFELIDPALDRNDPDSWQNSWNYFGSPGKPNPIERPDRPQVVVNEIMFAGNDNTFEWIELLNLDDEAVDMSGWFVLDNKPNGVKLPFPDGTVIQPGEFFVLINSYDTASVILEQPNTLDISSTDVSLSNSSDFLLLFDENYGLVNYALYDGDIPGYTEAAEHGHSLEYWNHDLVNWDFNAWAASQDSLGTPGAENYIYDIFPPKVLSVAADAKDTIMVEFNEPVSFTTITNVENYFVDQNIGSPDYVIATDTTAKLVYLNQFLAQNTSYSLAITGIMDKAENTIADTTIVFNTNIVGIENTTALPQKFALHNNYPNPFNPTTRINYDLPSDAHVKITVYDVMGREVCVLTDSQQSAGYKSLIWNAADASGRNVSSGFYFYVMKAGKFTQTQKMLFLK